MAMVNVDTIDACSGVLAAQVYCCSSEVGAIVDSSNEPGELSRWLCCDDSTIMSWLLMLLL